MPETDTFKWNRLFCSFYLTLPKTFFILKISKQAPIIEIFESNSGAFH